LTLTARDATDTQPLSEKCQRDATSKPRNGSGGKKKSWDYRTADRESEREREREREKQSLQQRKTDMKMLQISPGGKGGRRVGLTTLRPACADCLEILEASTSWSPKGLSRPLMGKLHF
jgi:hypothetical protein